MSAPWRGKGSVCMCMCMPGRIGFQNRGKNGIGTDIVLVYELTDRLLVARQVLGRRHGLDDECAGRYATVRTNG